MYLAANVSGNKMLCYYHSGAYGKDVPGQWSCCNQKQKYARGCCDTLQTDAKMPFLAERTYSAFSREHLLTSTPVSSTEDEMISSVPTAIDYWDSEGITVSESVPVKSEHNYVKFEKRNRFSDTQSIKSAGWYENHVLSKCYGGVDIVQIVDLQRGVNQEAV